jgi:hypothetical protein
MSAAGSSVSVIIGVVPVWSGADGRFFDLSQAWMKDFAL